MKLSIITINYNNKGGLEKTIASVMQQTWRDFEWILIDGGSTDGSKEVIENLAKNPDANISYWCSEPDKGIYNAMNKGIAHAKGEYLQFLNSGDWLYDENVYEKVFCQNFTEDIIITDICIETDTGKRVVINSAKGRELNFGTLLECSIPHSSTYIKKTLFEQIGLYNEDFKIVSDWKFFVDAIGWYGASYRYIDVPTTVFDMNGISNKQPDLLLKEEQQVRESYPNAILRDYRMFLEKERYLNDIKMYKFSGVLLEILHWLSVSICKTYISMIKICRKYGISK